MRVKLRNEIPQLVISLEDGSKSMVVRSHGLEAVSDKSVLIPDRTQCQKSSGIHSEEPLTHRGGTVAVVDK